MALRKLSLLIKSDWNVIGPLCCWERWPWVGDTIQLSCSWSAENGKWIFACPRSRLRIWSRETGSAVPSRVSLFISMLRLDLVLTYGIPPEFHLNIESASGIESNNTATTTTTVVSGIESILPCTITIILYVEWLVNGNRLSLRWWVDVTSGALESAWPISHEEPSTSTHLSNHFSSLPVVLSTLLRFRATVSFSTSSAGMLQSGIDPP